MKEAYPGYSPLSDKDVHAIWREALVIPDANILLNLYRYSKQTRVELLKLLRDLRSRIWLPHQAGLEFYRNRLEVIFDEASKYQSLFDDVNRLLADLDRTRGHPFVSAELRRELGLVQRKLEREVKKNIQELEALQSDDSILDEIVKLFSGRVGPALSDEAVQAIKKEGEDRYKRRIPPGFLDEKKPEDTRYGDLILWKQLLEKGAAEKKPVLLVSDDRKDDWWWRIKGRTIGPLPALREEFFAATGRPFHMYASDRFMEYAGRFLARPVERKAIDEAKATREQLAAERRASDELAVKAALNRYIVMSSDAGSALVKFLAEAGREGSPTAQFLAEAAKARGGPYDQLLQYLRVPERRPDFRNLFLTGPPPESTSGLTHGESEPSEEKKEQPGDDADHS